MRILKLKSLLIVFAVLIGGSKVNAQIDLNNAEALYIYNFLRHIKWEDSSVGETYVIGVLGKTDTYQSLINYTKGRKVGVKPIKVVQYSSVEEIGRCQVLLISQKESSKIDQISEKFKSSDCLIIGSKSGLSNNGAVIDFALVGGKLKFRLNEENAKKQNLVVSRALIDMAI